LPRLPSLLAAMIACASPAFAADLPALPSLATDPQLPPPSWKGLYVGSGVSFAVAKGAKGSVGGDVFAGYDHRFENGLVLGVQFDTGYNPWVVPNSRARCFDFAESSIKVGYEMGRLTPFVSAGVALAKGAPFTGGLPDANASINGLFSGPGGYQAVGVMGAGVDYALTNNLHVGVAAYINNGGGALSH
jgi:opacity protein-like surface antigen